MKSRKIVAIGATAAVAIAGLSFAAAPAYADPVTDGYSIVGSDTLQDAVSALANGTSITGASVKVSGAGKVLASWDAFTLGVTGGAGKIQTKAYGPIFDRPTGSGAGRNALLASVGGVSGSSFNYNGVNVADQVDLARSSSLSGTAGATLTYVPFGQDAISFVYKVGAAGTGDAAAATAWVSGLSLSELLSLYTSSTASPAGGSGYTVKPLALQASSGTWTTFLSNIGTTVAGVGSNVDPGTTRPENDGTVLAPTTDQIQLVPVSVANYIGQVNGASRINTFSAATVVGTIDGEAAPFTGTPSFSGTVGTSNLVPTTAFYNSPAWGRTVYIVVPTAKIAIDPGVAALINTTSTSSLTYWGASNLASTTKAVKIKFGFSAPVGGTVTRNG